MNRNRFRRRLDTIAAKLNLTSDEESSPEGRWLASLTDREREIEHNRCRDLIKSATSDELSELIKAFSIHPAKRGKYLLWPPPSAK
jgi:hypothetical protein